MVGNKCVDCKEKFYELRIRLLTPEKSNLINLKTFN